MDTTVVILLTIVATLAAVAIGWKIRTGIIKKAREGYVPDAFNAKLGAAVADFTVSPAPATPEAAFKVLTDLGASLKGAIESMVVISPEFAGLQASRGFTSLAQPAAIEAVAHVMKTTVGSFETANERANTLARQLGLLENERDELSRKVTDLTAQIRSATAEAVGIHLARADDAKLIGTAAAEASKALGTAAASTKTAVQSAATLIAAESADPATLQKLTTEVSKLEEVIVKAIPCLDERLKGSAALIATYRTVNAVRDGLVEAAASRSEREDEIREWERKNRPQAQNNSRGGNRGGGNANNSGNQAPTP